MIHGVVMAGGSGTRFWPESRKHRPKQLLNISGDRTMVRATVERMLPLMAFERILVITGRSHEHEIREQLPELTPDRVLAEPVGRNTAPCIALAAERLMKEDPDAIMVVLPADHLIGKQEEFLDAVRVAVEVVTGGHWLLTFGVVPTRPETGYGYIQLGNSQEEIGGRKIHLVDRFVEKPDMETAESYVASGKYLWNSGMFVWKAADIMAAIAEHLPDLHKAITGISDRLGTPEEAEAIEEAYASIEPVSIDYGVMEKADNVVCLPIDVDWNDVGSWASLHGVWDSDGNGNATRGEVVSHGSAGCVVSSPHKLTALIGLDDVIVVDTPDALLVCRKDRAQDVRKLQEILKEQGYDHLL